MTTGKDSGFFARRSFGQNFLHDQAAISRIVGAARLSPRDHVIEIGPGRGALTGKLLATGAKVAAIEADRTLLPLLEEKFGSYENFRLISGDALRIGLAEVFSGNAVKVVANLPYNISTAILQKLAAERQSFALLVLMFQREVAGRIMAPPGDSLRGYLSVVVQRSFTIERLFDVPPESFRPRPKVTSTVLRLIPKLPYDETSESELLALLSVAFRQRRKTLYNNLKSVYKNADAVLARADIDPGRRAETLTVEEWERLCGQVQTY